MYFEAVTPAGQPLSPGSQGLVQFVTHHHHLSGQMPVTIIARNFTELSSPRIASSFDQEVGSRRAGNSNPTCLMPACLMHGVIEYHALCARTTRVMPCPHHTFAVQRFMLCCAILKSPPIFMRRHPMARHTFQRVPPLDPKGINLLDYNNDN